MKVRCIDNKDINYGMLTIGEVYDVQAKNPFRYEVVDDLGRYIYFNRERFEEFKEDKEVQEKTFREVSATIKKDEVWSDGIYEISKDEDGIKIKRLDKYVQEDKNKIPFMYFYDDKKFVLKRKQYSFEEAFKAYEEGKEIQSCFKNFKIKKLNNKPHYIYKHMSEWDYVDNDDTLLSIEEIQGKWYIND